MFINQHFIVIDPIDEDLTITKFYDLVDEIERKEQITIHTTTIDPWNELTEEFISSDLGRENKYLSRILGQARKNARKTNRHNCIINHVRDQPMVTAMSVAGTELRYFPIPTARDFAGGQVWFRKGLSVLIPWRPPYGLPDADGSGAEKNEVHLKVAKSKPKGVSKNGVYKLFWTLTATSIICLTLKATVFMQTEAQPTKKRNQVKIPQNGIISTSQKLRNLANQKSFLNGHRTTQNKNECKTCGLFSKE